MNTHHSASNIMIDLNEEVSYVYIMRFCLLTHERCQPPDFQILYIVYIWFGMDILFLFGLITFGLLFYLLLA